MSDRPLNHQQLAFCAYYAGDPEHNGKRAAIEAGYSAKTAEVQASQLLSSPKVKAEVQRRIAKQGRRIELDADVLFRELLHVATFDIGQVLDDQGNPRKLSEMPEATRRAIVGIEIEEVYVGSGDERVGIGRVRKVKFADKLKAIELIGKHLKLWVEKHEHEHYGKLTLEQLLLESEGEP